MLYLTLKWLHVLCATLLVGTGLGSAFYLFMSWRGPSRPAFRHTARLVVKADWWITTPTVILQPVTGIALIMLGGWDWRSGWLVLSYVLYLVAGLAWLPVVWQQIRLRDLLAGRAGPVDAAVDTLMAGWVALGCVGFGAMVTIYWLMVVKP